MKVCLNQSMKKKEYSDLDLSPISDLEIIPPEIVIYLTGTCKYADCKYCIIKDNFSGKFLSLKILKKIFRDMNDLYIPFVSFTGGEPFDFEEGLEKVISLAKENNLFINQIITNGSFARNKTETISKLKSLKKSGFSHINMGRKLVVPTLTISMDKEHQKFIPLNNIKNLISCSKKVFGKYINITINFVLFSEEDKETIKEYKWLKGIKVNFSRVCYEGRAKDLKNKKLLPIKDYLEEWDNPCNWYNKKWPTIPTVFPDGQINFCCYFGLNKIFSLGNLKDISLKEALKKINDNKILIGLFKYGPIKMASFYNHKISNKYTYGKCGFCNILVRNLRK